ncbi:MAG: MCE family protein [Sphingomonadales bacterium]|nr:MCE family protein [Sphingomonadales bacterium]
METRAHHLLIGAFMVVMVASFLGFLIWLAKIDIDQEFGEYDIYFDESVAGLTKSSVVQYNGIPVGQVWDIRIDPNNPNRVLVKVEIESDIDIYEDSVAVLAMQGITGVAFVQIEGGSAEAAILQADGDVAPIIKSRISAIQELFTGAPDFINEAIGVVNKINELLNEENRASIGNILRNMDDVSQNFAEGTEDIAAVVTELNRSIKSVGDAAEAIAEVATGIEGELEDVLNELDGVLSGANKLMEQLNDLVYENEGAVTTFTNGTLPEISRLVIDARRLAIVLSSLAENLEDDPTGLIFSPSKPEYSPEK